VWRRVRAKDPSAPLALSQREAVLTLLAGDHYPAAYHAVFAHDFAGQLARVTQPTLVMAGPDDTIFDSLEPAFRALRHGKRCVLPRGGTYVCDREPDLVAAALTDFFNEEEAP
jgi:pimeloyl-ACP methyl ester carboxylesterase